MIRRFDQKQQRRHYEDDRGALTSANLKNRISSQTEKYTLFAIIWRFFEDLWLKQRNEQTQSVRKKKGRIELI